MFVAGLAALDHPQVRPARAGVVVIPDRPWLVTLLTAVARRPLACPAAGQVDPLPST